MPDFRRDVWRCLGKVDLPNLRNKFNALSLGEKREDTTNDKRLDIFARCLAAATGIWKKWLASTADRRRREHSLLRFSLPTVLTCENHWTVRGR